MKIVQTNTVIEYFIAENLNLIIGGALKDFQKKNNAKIQFLNVPQNIPPDAPRIIVSAQNVIINVSLTRFEIICKIPDHITEDANATILFTKKNVEDILSQLWVAELKYNWLGMIATLEFAENKPDKPAIELAKPFFDKLININRDNRDLGTFEIKFGFKEGNFYKNYNITCFETRDIKIDPSKFPNWNKVFDLEEVSEITNSGLRIIFDINNKAKERNKDCIADLDDLIIDFEKTMQNIPEELNIGELL